MDAVKREPAVSYDDVAAAAQITGYEVLANLRRRVHCVQYAG